MKKCPYCAEEIRDEAIVCKHCGRELDAQAVAQVSQTDSPAARRKKIGPYYVALDEDGRHRGGLVEWPMPSEDGPGRVYSGWNNEGVFLHTILGLILMGNGLDEALHEASFQGRASIYKQEFTVNRGFLDSKSTVFREFYKTQNERYVKVPKARLIRRVKAYRPSLMRTFACDCAERILDVIGEDRLKRFGRETDQAFQRGMIGLAREVASYDREYEQWLEAEQEDLDDGDLGGGYANPEWGRYLQLHGHPVITSTVNDWTNLENEAHAKVEQEPIHKDAARASTACMRFVAYMAANDSAKHARLALSNLVFLREGPLKAVRGTEAERQQIQERMDEAWIAELRWQAAHLAGLLGER